MSSKKAQAALEFLMTYGWAILVVLVGIAALAFSGVLNPQALLPDKCTLEAGFQCKDYKIDSATQSVVLNLYNAKGTDIILWYVNVSGDTLTGGCYAGVTNATTGMSWINTSATLNCDGTSCTNCGTFRGYYGCNKDHPQFAALHNNNNIGLQIQNGKSAEINIKCRNTIASTSSKTKAAIIISYYSADSTSGYLKRATGELLTQVQ